MKTREELLKQFRHDLPPYVDPLSGSSPYEPGDDIEMAIGSADMKCAEQQAQNLRDSMRLLTIAKLRMSDRRARWQSEPQRWRTTTAVEVLR